MAVLSDNVFIALKDVLSLPDHCIAAKIELKVRCVAIITCETYLSVSENEISTKKYKLVEIEGDENVIK